MTTTDGRPDIPQNLLKSPTIKWIVEDMFECAGTTVSLTERAAGRETVGMIHHRRGNDDRRAKSGRLRRR